MAHLVRYRTAEGSDAEHEVDELGEAIAYVERLRNESGVEGARIFRIEEVAFEFRPYFRVEIGGAAAAPVTAVAAPAVVTETVATDAVAAEAAVPAAAGWPDMSEPASAEPMPAPRPAETITIDPWADAPAAPAEETVANGGGRRGLFGR